MPIVDLKLNFPIAEEKALSAEFSKFISATIGKDEGYFLVFISHVPSLLFAGSSDKAFMLHLVRAPLSQFEVCQPPLSTQTSLGDFSPENNEKFSKAIAAWLEEKLAVKSNRGYMCVPFFLIFFHFAVTDFYDMYYIL